MNTFFKSLTLGLLLLPFASKSMDLNNNEFDLIVFNMLADGHLSDALKMLKSDFLKARSFLADTSQHEILIRRLAASSQDGLSCLQYLMENHDYTLNDFLSNKT